MTSLIDGVRANRPLLPFGQWTGFTLRAPQRPPSERAPRHCNHHAIRSPFTNRLRRSVITRVTAEDNCYQERLAVLRNRRAARLEGQLVALRIKGASASTPLRGILRLPLCAH